METYTKRPRYWTRDRKVTWIAGSLMILAIAAINMYVLLNAISPSPDLRQPPPEKNRMVHPAGFSIIIPGRTRAHITDFQEERSIGTLPDGGRSRYHPVLSVRRMGAVTEPVRHLQREYVKAEFQQQPAWVYSGPSGEYHHWSHIFRREDAWYEVVLLLPDPYPSQSPVPPLWQPYLNTFRVETTRAPSPSSQAIHRMRLHG